MKEKLLEVKDLSIGFQMGDSILPAVDNISFDIKEGEILGIVGESGCGKSITFMSIMGLLPEEGRILGGEILFNKENLLNYKENQMREIRGREISIIFQEPMTSLNPVYKVGRQVVESILIHTDLTKEQAKDKAIEMMKDVGLPSPERIYNQYPHELSGGMRQRVMIAMALVCDPKLLIADEPTTALDVTIQAQILDLIKKINKDTGTSVALITHDIGVVSEMCDRVAIMYAGHIVEIALVSELYVSMKHPYTIGLMNSIPLPNRRGEKLYTIPGRVPGLTERGKGCRFAGRCPHVMEKCKISVPPLYKVGPDHYAKCFLLEKKGDE